jgi:hypothetical protein
VQSLNESLQSVGELPVRLRRIGETNYTITKVAKIESAVRKYSESHQMKQHQVYTLYNKNQALFNACPLGLFGNGL